MTEISVFIITKNEEDRIARAILSVRKIAAEIIVVDSESSDNTVEVCKNLGAIVVVNPWPGYVKQKAFAESLCKNNWILNLDADEELSQGLQDEIHSIFVTNLQDKYHAYKIKLTIVHRHDNQVRFLAPVNKAIRLYNRKFYSFANNITSNVHDSVTLNAGVEFNIDKIYILNEIAHHYSGSSIEQLVNKANLYSTQQAQDLAKSKRKISKLRIICEIFFGFIKAFFIRRYFIFGFNGFVDSVIFAFARFIRLAKVREIEQNHHLNHKNKTN